MNKSNIIISIVVIFFVAIVVCLPHMLGMILNTTFELVGVCILFSGFLIHTLFNDYRDIKNHKYMTKGWIVLTDILMVLAVSSIVFALCKLYNISDNEGASYYTIISNAGEIAFVTGIFLNGFLKRERFLKRH